jgi:hypothetical protein
MSNPARLSRFGAGVLLALTALLVLVQPEASRGQVPSASVTVCQVSGSASAPDLVQVTVSVDQVVAFLNAHPGSFVGACPSSGGNGSSGSGSGGGTTSGTPLNGAVTVCRLGGTAYAPVLSPVVVGVDQVTAYLNQNPGSFLGSCPAAAGGNASEPSGSAGPVSAVVTVCRVTGSANAPGLAQLALAVDEVAAFLNRNPGSFIGTCPGTGGTVTSGPGRILGIPLGAALTICQVTASGNVLRYVQANVAVDKVSAYLNQHAGSYVGLCPSASDQNGTVGNEPIGYLTICRVTGVASSPLAAVTVRADQLEAYLARAGTVLDPSSSGCQSPTGDPGTDPPGTTPVGEETTIVVHTTPNTVVTARGAGVDESTKSDKKGRAILKVKAKKPGLVVVRGTAGRVTRTIGAASPRRSGGNLTG